MPRPLPSSFTNGTETPARSRPTASRPASPLWLMRLGWLAPPASTGSSASPSPKTGDWSSSAILASSTPSAVTAETNAQVATLNAAIQARRRDVGDLDDLVVVPVAGSETAGPGDVVVTRLNNRAIVDEHGEPVRNRELWQIDDATLDGSLTVSRIQGHGHVTLPADYTRSYVRLGYAATAHGHQGDTVDASYTLDSASTTHRGLYVGATRGRDDNHLLVITDEPDLTEARDVLEYVLTNDRADVPAIVQRRHLADEARDVQPSLTEQLAVADRNVTEAQRRARPFDRAVREANRELESAENTLAGLREQMRRAQPWARRQFREPIVIANDAVLRARQRHTDSVNLAEPTRHDLQEAIDDRFGSTSKRASIGCASDLTTSSDGQSNKMG